MKRPSHKIAAAALVAASILNLWPYALHDVNWYGHTMWDGVVAIAGGALGNMGIPVWFYLMCLLPIVTLLGGIALLIPRLVAFRFGVCSAIMSLILFPFGTAAGIASLIILGVSTRNQKGEQGVAPNA